MSLEHDLRIELYAKNNRLWHAVYDQHKSIPDFLTSNGLPSAFQFTVGAYISLKRSPYNAITNQPAKAAQVLSDLLMIPVRELFPFELYKSIINPKIVVEGDSHRFIELSAAARQRLLPQFTQDFDGPIFQSELQQRLHQALQDVLNRRYEKLLVLRFGLDGQGERTLDQVCEHFGLSRQRISQMEQRALSKLRNARVSRRLIEFLISENSSEILEQLQSDDCNSEEKRLEAQRIVAAHAREAQRLKAANARQKYSDAKAAAVRDAGDVTDLVAYSELQRAEQLRQHAEQMQLIEAMASKLQGMSPDAIRKLLASLK